MELIGHLAPLRPRCLGVVLDERGADEGRDDAPTLPPSMRQHVALKWTRQRCQEACSTLATAALMPSWASEITSLTPRRPRRASLRRNSVQNASSGPVAKFYPSAGARAANTADIGPPIRTRRRVWKLPHPSRHARRPFSLAGLWRQRLGRKVQCLVIVARH
jgi:hypothetical protein